MAKIYIAGPMSGIENHNLQAFEDAEKYWAEKGAVVFCPTTLPQDSNISQAQYMDIDLAMIRACDVIYMLKGWEESKGATLEKTYADYLGIGILYEKFAEITKEKYEKLMADKGIKAVTCWQENMK